MSKNQPAVLATLRARVVRSQLRDDVPRTVYPLRVLQPVMLARLRDRVVQP